MQLFNPTKKTIELRYGGKPYVFQPKESKDLPEHVVIHFTKTTNSPLVVQTPMHDKEVKISDVVYSEMKWKDLIKMASVRGVFFPPMKRVEVEKAMEEYDQERGTIQKPSN